MLDELARREELEARAKEQAVSAQLKLQSALAELSCSKFALDQHAIVAVTDMDGTTTYVNEKFCEISQYSRDELIGQTHRIINSGLHPKSFWVAMWRTVLKGRVWRGEVCNRAKDGSMYWVDTTIVPYTDRQGRPTKLVAIRSDITDRKQTEVQLLESRERYDLAVRGSNDGIWDWIVTTGEVYYSPRFKDLLGYVGDEFPHRLDSFTSHLHPDDLSETWQAVQRHLEHDSGIIAELGEWVLRTACCQLADWQDEMGTDAPPRLSVNISRKQFGHPQLAESIRETLEEFFIDPSRIELEVTEDAFCNDLPRAKQILESLKSLGVKLSIDDFGVGSSTFAALHQFPVDTLKVDRSLLADLPNSPETATLIHGLVVMADGLGMMLVLEGVEEHAQFVALQELGCSLAQGYFFSRPMPAEQVPRLLRNGVVA